MRVFHFFPRLSAASSWWWRRTANYCTFQTTPPSTWDIVWRICWYTETLCTISSTNKIIMPFRRSWAEQRRTNLRIHCMDCIIIALWIWMESTGSFCAEWTLVEMRGDRWGLAIKRSFWFRDTIYPICHCVVETNQCSWQLVHRSQCQRLESVLCKEPPMYSPPFIPWTWKLCILIKSKFFNIYNGDFSILRINYTI